MLSGVPIGSVLGPILFGESQVKLFADDIKLYIRVQKDDPKGSDTIQNDLTNLEVWSDTWLLHFNAAKCKCMHLGHDNLEFTIHDW